MTSLIGGFVQLRRISLVATPHTDEVGEDVVKDGKQCYRHYVFIRCV